MTKFFSLGGFTALVKQKHCWNLAKKLKIAGTSCGSCIAELCRTVPDPIRESIEPKDSALQNIIL